MIQFAAAVIVLCIGSAAAAGSTKDKTTWLDMNPQGKSLGKVEDLIVDLKGEHIPHVVLEDVVVNLGSGKVRGVIVAQDGRKGDEPKLTLPPGSLTLGKSE